MDVFEQALHEVGGIMEKIEISPGIYQINYRLDKYASGPMQTKTVYDPKIWSDAKMADMATEAAHRGALKFMVDGNVNQYIEISGVRFHVPIKIEEATGRVIGVRTSYPVGR